MSSTALFEHNLGAQIFSASLSQSSENGYFVNINNSLHKASLAASCLLSPQAGDIVLVAYLENGEYCILSVLVQAQPESATLSLPKNSAIKCQGALSLIAEQGLNLRTADLLDIQARETQFTSAKAQAHVLEGSAVFQNLKVCSQNLVSLGKSALQNFKNFTQCLGESKRMVEGTDENHCKNSVLIASEQATVLTKNSHTLVKETARTDAALIQLG